METFAILTEQFCGGSFLGVTTSPDRVMIDFSAEGIREVVLFGRYNYNRAHPPLAAHRHENVFEICLLESGSQTYVVDAAVYECTGGDIIITKPGETHGTGGKPEQRGRLYWLQFSQVEDGRTFLGLTPQESKALMHQFLSLTSRHFRNGDGLAAAFQRIFSAYDEVDKPLRAPNIKNLLLRLVLDAISIATHRNARPYSIGMQRAIHHIGETPRNIPDIRQLAHIAGMSESYFKVSFKRETGMPPVEYAMRRRVEEAGHRLRTSECPITSLAMDLGFATSQHFATVFKRFTGLSPRAYRQRSLLYPLLQLPLTGAGPDFHPSGPSSHSEG